MPPAPPSLKVTGALLMTLPYWSATLTTRAWGNRIELEILIVAASHQQYGTLKQVKRIAGCARRTLPFSSGSKEALSSQLYFHFLKMLHLFHLELISARELVSVVEDLLCDASPEIMDKFKQMIGSHSYHIFSFQLSPPFCPQVLWKRIPTSSPFRRPILHQYLLL